MRRGRRGSQRVRYWVWPLRTTGVIHQGNSQGSALGGCEGCPGCPCRDTQPPTPPGAQGAVSALRGGGQAAAGRRGVGREASRPAGAACVPPAAPHGCPASGRCTDAGPQQSQDLNPHLRGLCLATNSLIRSLTRSQDRATKSQCKNLNSKHECLKGTAEVSNAYQHMTKSLGHDNIVQQRVADSQVAVIGHG